MCECVVWHYGRDGPAGGREVRHRLGDNTLSINLKGIIYEHYNINTKVKEIYSKQ